MLIGHIDMINARHPLRPVRRRAAAARGTLLQVMASDLALRRLGRIAQAAARARVRARRSPTSSGHPLRVILLPVGIVCGARHLRRDVRARWCLTFWTIGSSGGREHVHVRRQHDDVVPAQHLRTWLRRLLAFVVPLAFVDVLPRPLPPRQARSARLPDRVPVPRAARRRSCSPRLTGFAWRFVGPPLPEHGIVIRVERVSKTFAVWRRAGRVRRARVHRRRGRRRVVQRRRRARWSDTSGPTARARARRSRCSPACSCRPRARCTSPGSCRRATASRSRAASAWCSGSARCSGGTCRSPTRSTCCATSTRSTAAPHRDRLDECIELLQLDEFLNTPVRQLSLGQRMRGELTAALLHDPELLFLDEPTIGLDVVSKDRVRAFLADLNARHGTTRAADHARPRRHRAAVLPAADHRPRPASSTTAASTRCATSTAPSARSSSTSPSPRPPIEVAAAEVVKVDGPRQWLRFRRDRHDRRRAHRRHRRPLPLRDLTLEEPAIEDIVRRIYVEGM